MRRLGLLVSLLGLAAYLATGVVFVRPGEQAVVRRFGRVLDDRPEPGLWIGLPWGMDRVERVAIDQVRRVEVGYQPDQESSLLTPPGQLLTGDHNLVDLQVVLHYTVDRERLVNHVLHADRVDDLVERAAEATLGEWVGCRTVDDVLLHGKMDLPPWLVEAVQERLRPYGLGIVLHDATVAHLLPPLEVKSAFDQVTQAQTEIGTRLNRARQEEVRIRLNGEAERHRLEQLALAYADEQRKLARAEAASFTRRLRQYQQMRASNPETLSATWWYEMGKLFSRLKEEGRVDLLDHHLGADGLDITTLVPPRKK